MPALVNTFVVREETQDLHPLFRATILGLSQLVFDLHNNEMVNDGFEWRREELVRPGSHIYQDEASTLRRLLSSDGVQVTVPAASKAQAKATARKSRSDDSRPSSSAVPVLRPTSSPTLAPSRRTAAGPDPSPSTAVTPLKRTRISSPEGPGASQLTIMQTVSDDEENDAVMKNLVPSSLHGGWCDFASSYAGNVGGWVLEIKRDGAVSEDELDLFITSLRRSTCTMTAVAPDHSRPFDRTQ